MEITAFIMGTCRPQRLAWLEKSMDYLDSQNFPFVKKILAIDEFDGFTFPKRLDDKFTDRGWIVIIDSHKSRIKSMDHAFEHIKSEVTFYNEEDVMATMPRSYLEPLKHLFHERKVGNRKCAMVSLTLGGSSNHFPGGQYGDLKDVRTNLIYENQDEICFLRLEEKRNDYFFEFPGLFVNTEIFKDCHKFAKDHYPGKSVEAGLTSAYFEIGYDKDFYKCSIAQHNLEHIIETEPNLFIKECRLLRNLDPMQGNSSSGGNHLYTK